MFLKEEVDTVRYGVLPRRCFCASGNLHCLKGVPSAVRKPGPFGSRVHTTTTSTTYCSVARSDTAVVCDSTCRGFLKSDFGRTSPLFLTLFSARAHTSLCDPKSRLGSGSYISRSPGFKTDATPTNMAPLKPGDSFPDGTVFTTSPRTRMPLRSAVCPFPTRPARVCSIPWSP